jgi:putative hydrolase, CocE/NonD family
MGFAHFAGSDSGNVGWLLRRTGQPMLKVASVTTSGDSVLLKQDDRTIMRAAWHGDTLVGVQFVNDRPLDRRYRLVRRATPGVVEHDYQVWTMPASDSQYAVTIDSTVLMPTRDGAKLETYIVRPVGAGPFGVVMQRSPYRATNPFAGTWWASRGYIYIGQLTRGRGKSSGDVADFGDYDTDIQDGYDAVEWAARLPGANGKVGMIGHSDEGRLVWFAAVSAPPHLAAIAPTAATLRSVAYRALRRHGVRTDQRGLGLPDARAGSRSEHRRARHRRGDHPPAALHAAAAARLRRRAALGPMDRASDARRVLAEARRHHVHRQGEGAGALDGRVARRLARAARLHRCAAPGAEPSGWHLVMGVHAHKGVDYVAGDFGPQARYAYRDLQLRWFDHYLMGRDNGVDRLPPVDIFVQGDNTWRKENEWPLARARATKWYVSSGGAAQTSAGNGVLDTLPPRGAVADTFTYDPADPTPYLIDSRELEESLNEDYTALNASRRDALVYTSRPLTRPLEVTGEMSATVWAASDARDTDWAIMLLDVFPDGHAERVQDGFARARFRKGMDREVPLVPGRVERYDIDLWFTSKVFAPGHRLRVSISSALFPKYDRNLNTGGNNERDSTFVVAHQRLVHDAAHPTHVVLPVVPR